MAATSYPPEIQQLLKAHTKYQDASAIAYASVVVRGAKLTEENRMAHSEELSSMRILYSKLNSLRETSDAELKTLCEREYSSLRELVKKVPNIEELPQYSGFTSDQRLTITSTLTQAERQAERRKEIDNYDPRKADQVKLLFSEIEPRELAHILKISLDLAQELKENVQTSNGPQEPCQTLEDDLEENIDSRKPDQIIEDILGKVKSMSTKIKNHREIRRDSSCLFRMVGHLIGVLQSWLELEEVTKKEREDNIIRQKENAAKEREEVCWVAWEEDITGEKEIATDMKRRPKTKTMKKVWKP